MPYIHKEYRKYLEENLSGTDVKKLYLSPGELNYLITSIINSYIGNKLSYDKINQVIGVLECVKQEFYRRAASPYENQKCLENGDVY